MQELWFTYMYLVTLGVNTHINVDEQIHVQSMDVDKVSITYLDLILLDTSTLAF